MTKFKQEQCLTNFVW